jgi:malonyl-CoA O-methyltransferase
MRQLLRRIFKHATPVLPSVQAYRLWAALYPPHAHNPLMQLEQTAMLQLMPDVRGKWVLDLACGTGRYGLIALEKGAACVVGVDNSPDMLQQAQLSHAVLGTVDAIPLADALFDVVICVLALGHVADITLPMREMARVLKPGGVALISDFHPFQALNGAQRSFKDGDGKVYVVEHHVHLYSAYHAAAQQHGMTITGVAEPMIEGTSPQPVVLVLRLEKTL